MCTSGVVGQSQGRDGKEGEMGEKNGGVPLGMTAKDGGRKGRFREEDFLRHGFELVVSFGYFTDFLSG